MKETVTILIDDDELIHVTWRLRAKAAGKPLRSYFSVPDFLKEASRFSLNSEVYIDGNLGPGIRGEVESKKIYDSGFHAIRIETGEEPDSIQKPDWVIEIRGKNPPW